MNRMIGWMAIFSVLFLNCRGQTPSPQTLKTSDDPRIQKIDLLLQEAESGGLCGTILIRSRNQVLLHKSYGWADREAGRPMTPSTGFLIGSLVKPITSATILKLEEQGRLSSQDTLGRFFPEAPQDKQKITLMQMMTHRAGMRDLFGGDYELVGRDELVRTALKASLIAPPGSQERYSNSAYSLLAVIIEKASGRPYEEFVRQEVLQPAGAGGIGYVLAGWENDQLAVGYDSSGRRWGAPLEHAWFEDGPSWNLRGNGGMLGTAEEMAGWYKALFEGKVLGKEALEKYLGFNAGRSRKTGSRVLGQAGGNRVFNTLQVSYIDQDVHMTFFTSDARQRAEALWRKIRDQVISLAQEGESIG